MEVKYSHEREPERVTGPVFETQVHRKPGFTEPFGDLSLSVSEVVFAPGERTTMHKHTIRQILYVTGGEGIVATADTEYDVSTGDMISIPPDEEHWHGATSDSEFRHITIVVRDAEHGGTIPVPSSEE